MISIFGQRNSRKPNHNRQSIFFVTLPKSGTVFTWDTLVALTGLTQPNLSASPAEWQDYRNGLEYRHSTIYASGDFATQRLLPHRLRNYLPEGYVFGAHMPPVFHNIRALEQAGVERIVVLLRDPRDATVSWSHHVAAQGPDYSNYQSKIYSLTPGFFDLPAHEQLTHHVRNFLPMAVTWLEAWLDFYANKDRRLEVLLVYFDELKADPVGYFGKILAHFGYCEFDAELIPIPEKGTRHYRQGEHEAWKTEFGDVDKTLSEALIGNRLVDAYQRASQASIEAASTSDSQGQDQAAAKLNMLADALEQFPNSPAIASAAINEAKTLGAPQNLFDLLATVEKKKPDTDSLLRTSEEARGSVSAIRAFLERGSR